MKPKGEITPSVLSHCLMWGMCNLKDPRYKWTKFDANIFDILMNAKSRLYHERYLKTKNK
jgi:hypothetical protein